MWLLSLPAPTVLLLIQRGRDEVYPTPLAARVVSWLGSKLETDFPCLDVMALPMWQHSSPLMAAGIFACTGDYSSITYGQDCVGDTNKKFWRCDLRILKALFTPKIPPCEVLPFSASYHIIYASLKGTPLARPNNSQVFPGKLVPKAFCRFCSMGIGKRIHTINVHISQDNLIGNAYCNHWEILAWKNQDQKRGTLDGGERRKIGKLGGFPHRVNFTWGPKHRKGSI